MSPKPVRLRAVAYRDEQEAVDYYASVGGPSVADAFVDALREAYASISRRPALGSPRYGHVLNLSGLRSRSLKRFPYLVFYVELEEHIEVWRVLHAHRDVPALIG